MVATSATQAMYFAQGRHKKTPAEAGVLLDPPQNARAAFDQYFATTGPPNLKFTRAVKRSTS
jgi:hypothetical protein